MAQQVLATKPDKLSSIPRTHIKTKTKTTTTKQPAVVVHGCGSIAVEAEAGVSRACPVASLAVLASSRSVRDPVSNNHQ